MTDTLLVRLKPYDPRRGHVLRRYTYAGIKFQEERGWYRVERPVAEYLRAVREVPSDRYAPLAFDVCTEAEAKALDAGESGPRPGAGRPALPDAQRRALRVIVSLTPSESAELLAVAGGGSIAVTTRELALAAVRAGITLDEPVRAGRATEDSALGRASRQK